ncbi:flavin reductase family protein [Prauserella flavalba]|uniref:flavin reductase family protein n=1 Tax=Prauserella flavalba TaxID=1477506 RepID=UPI0036E94C10
MEMDPREFRRCLGRFATGVTVITYRSAEGIRGATVNSFTSVSLEPRLVLVSLARRTQACTAMEGASFAINVLRSDQTDLAYQFAGRPRPGLRIDWQSGVDDVPSLPGAIAVLTCRPWRRYDGGDHILQLGEVVDAHIRHGDPLVFSDGRFTTTGLPVLEAPLVLSLDAPPAPGWTAAASRLHHYAEAG